MNTEITTDIENLTFEEAYSRLEETVAQLESDSLPLAQAIALYQRGMALAKLCHTQLDTAELTVKTLTPAGDIVDFDAA